MHMHPSPCSKHCLGQGSEGPPLLAQVTRLRFIRMYALLSSQGLYPGQHHLLIHLGRHEGLSQAQLAKSLMVQPSTLAVMVTRMERSGLVVREKDAQDKRLIRIRLTEHGYALLREADESLKRIEEETFQGFTEEEKLQFNQFAQRMKDNLVQAAQGESGTCPWF